MNRDHSERRCAVGCLRTVTDHFSGPDVVQWVRCVCVCADYNF